MPSKALFAGMTATLLLAVPLIVLADSATSPAIATSVCAPLTRSLAIGARGSDVAQLQQFLKAQGYLSVAATGYFGTLTRRALGAWQASTGITAAGSAGWGIFGPLSRSAYERSCTPGTSGTQANKQLFSAAPQAGSAPLAVQFSESAPQGAMLGNSINFGDGSTGTMGFIPVCSSCNAMATASHTYVQPGIYTASLTSNHCSCPANGVCNCPNIMILATTTVTVSGTSSTSGGSDLQVNAPATVTLQAGGIAEVRNESYYFTLTALTASSATIQLTPVGCWNSFPSDTPPRVRCMLAMLPIAPITLSVGEAASGTRPITLTQIVGTSATFSIGGTVSQ